MVEEVVKKPHVSKLVLAPLAPMKSQHGSTQGMSTQFRAHAASTSTPRGKQTLSSSSSRLTSIDPIKKGSMHEIYEAGKFILSFYIILSNR